MPAQAPLVEPALNLGLGQGCRIAVESSDDVEANVGMVRSNPFRSFGELPDSLVDDDPADKQKSQG